jgi:large subunit ribosomal protein L29
MRPDEIRAMTDEQLLQRISDLNQEHFNLRFQLAAYKNPNPGRFRQVKRDIARIKTILHERELERQVQG